MTDDTYELPDGSAFTIASFPLPKDHWLYASGPSAPPMPLRMGAGPLRDEMVAHIWAASKYAIRAATMNGREEDFDPDALCQNMVVGLIGYFTADGSGGEPGDDPKPLPSIVTDIIRLGETTP